MSEVTPRFKTYKKKKARKRVNPISERRLTQLEQRKIVRDIVLTRDKTCQARRDPEHECFFIDGLEVDEIAGGSWRNIEWLDPDRCQALCNSGHRKKHADREWAIKFGLWSPHPNENQD